MDPTLTAVLAVVSPAVAALFGALMIAWRGRADDWKEIATRERDDHKETKRIAAEDARESATVLRALAEDSKVTSQELRTLVDLIRVATNQRPPESSRR